MPNRSVLLVCRSIRGGMKQHISSLAKGLAENGFEVTIAGPVKNFPGSYCVKIITLTIPENPLNFAGISSINSLARLISENRYDLVHTHGYVAGIIGRIAALRAGDLRAGKPGLIHTVHNFLPGFSPLTLYAAKRMEVWLSSHTGRIITVSEHLREQLIKIGIPAEKISTVYNGISPSVINMAQRHKTRRVLGLPPHFFVIGTVARLIQAKGVDLFIQALALAKKNNPSIKGIVVGEGPETPELHNLAKELGMTDTILFLGHRSDVPALLCAFDLYIQPSRQEGFGISILEAQYSGLPVIASATGGIPEIINHGKSGLLFPSGDYRVLADGISLLLNNPEYRHSLAIEGMRRVQENYTCNKMIQATVQLYQDLINQRKVFASL